MKAFFTSCNYLISKVNLFQKFIFLCHCACIPSTTLRNLVTIMVTCPLRRNCTSRGFVWIATYLNEIRSAKIWLDERQGVFNCRIGLLRPIAKNPFFSLGNTKNWKYFIWADVLREKESDIKRVHIFCHLRKMKKWV